MIKKRLVQGLSRNTVLMAASSGGHLEQLLSLEALSEDFRCVLLTESCGYKITAWQEEVYFFRQINRKDSLLLVNMAKIFFRTLKIIKKEEPIAVISTGALLTFPICMAAKLKGVKVVFIESFAKAESPTLTGRLVYPFADIFIVQWESMLKHYPKAYYGGWIY